MRGVYGAVVTALAEKGLPPAQGVFHEFGVQALSKPAAAALLGTAHQLIDDQGAIEQAGMKYRQSPRKVG